jgi:translocation and assembly module TamA
VGLADLGDRKKYPNSLRFFAGGDQSVRGYNWKTLGPTDLEGDVIGGQNVITAAIEYNHKISTDWLLATFFDAGNAFDNELKKLYYGAGVGARWISPVGLIRLDMGFPLNGDDKVTDLESTVIYFGFEVSL